MSEPDVGAYLERATRLFPNRLAAVDATERLTFTELHDQASRLAGGLLGLGLKHGDRVVDARWNSAQSVVYDWAMALAGLVKVPLTPRLSVAEFAHLVDNAEARAFLTEAEHADVVEAVSASSRSVEFIVADGVPGALSRADVTGEPLRDRRVCDPDDLYALRYTGGTTGLPKASTQTHRAFLATGMSVLLDYMDLREDDLVFPTQPYTHGGSLYSLPAAMRGSGQVLLRKFDVDAVLDTVERERVTVLKIVPTTLYRLIEAQRTRPRDLGSLRLIGYGAAPMPEYLLRESMDVFGCGFTQIYSLAAAPATISALDERTHAQERANPTKRLRSVGRPSSITDVAIVDENGTPVAEGEVGEVTVRGSYVTHGFWNDPEESAKTLRNGTVFTGDMGYLEDGFLYLVGRQNDLIISGGFNVYPAEVEQVMISIPEISTSAVTSVPDIEWGEKVVSAVVLKPDATITPEEIIAKVKAQLAGYKCPKHIEIVDSLPLTANSKVDRKATRAIIERALAAGRVEQHA